MGTVASDTTKPLKLTVSVASIAAGCYAISVSNSVKNAATYLCLGQDQIKLDITGGYGSDKLKELLRIINADKLWGKSVDAYALHVVNGKPVPESKSNAVKMALPIEPYKGNLSLEEIGSDRKLKYTGIREGRLLHTRAINGWHLIKFNGFAELDPTKRGLNCITYVGAAFGRETGMNGYGTQLARALGAQPCEMECKTHADILTFFKKEGASGKYLMWDENHVVVVKDCVVFEFCKSKNGFAKTPVTSWGFSHRPYWIRKL